MQNINIKEAWQKLSGKTKKLILIIAIGTALLAGIGIAALQLGGRGGYATLFTGMNSEDAQAVVSMLQENGISYRYNDKSGAVQVPADTADETRAMLLTAGYPQSGFTYDMYRDNAGIMTTESDKKTYTLYELQDRLGAQIRLFDGVRDARVTIAEAEQAKYALGDSGATDASASVVVTMDPGQELTAKKAAAVKNLIARAVRGMNFTNVSVFDAETMTEVGGESQDSAADSGESMAALTSLVESNIAGNVRRVLEMLYGQNKVAVSVKGTLNMERLIQETTTYTTPDKIDEQDKTGLLEHEEVAGEQAAQQGQNAGGVAGADANADTNAPAYTNEDGTAQADANAYANNSAVRDYLFNSVKEQRQLDPGVLQNTTVGVAIDTDDLTVSEADLRALVANAAGIDRETAAQKITIVRALSADSKAAAQAAQNAAGAPRNTGLSLPLMAALGAGGALLVLLLLLLLLTRRRARKEAAARAEAEAQLAQSAEAAQADRDKTPRTEAEYEEDEEDRRNEEILNLKMRHSLKLKQNIGEFIDENPQAAARMVQNWLEGEGSGNGGGRNDRK